jgi:para-aminobenzoate synthetase/4-amino-4-deoxychorismate lyase
VVARALPWARFDDLRAGSSMLLRATHGVLRADRLEEVEPVVRAAEAAADQGRWAFGFVAYEAAPAFDPGLAVHPGVEGLPLAWFGVADEPLVVPPVTPTDGAAYTAGPWRCEWTREEHRHAVDAVRAHIAEGDTYQVNLTTRLTGPVAGDAAELYADLASAQHGAHNAFLDTGRFAVVSASPELFFSRRGREVAMRPMKGTARRGGTPDEDRRLADELRTSAKERAENVMIVDLVRNDLARIAARAPRVTRLCAVETYPTVHQLVSSVVAATIPEVGLVDVFRAVFPCGSVTGAPKHRTMEIIRDLEAGPRGVYCGAVGFVAPPGEITRFNVPIRTLLVDRERGAGTYGAGGGITWDSRADAEYDELLVKARILP